jgi:hypothetical protein
MQSLSKQHLQQHAQMVSQIQRQNVSLERQAAPRSSSTRAAALAHFPLSVSSSKSSQLKPKPAANMGKSQSLPRSQSFAAKSARRAASSRSVLRRAKQLAKALPRPTTLERAQRGHEEQHPADGGAEVSQRNQRILSHASERKKKTQEAMRKFLLATTLPSRHALPPAAQEERDDERDDFDDAELDEFLD